MRKYLFLVFVRTNIILLNIKNAATNDEQKREKENVRLKLGTLTAMKNIRTSKCVVIEPNERKISANAIADHNASYVMCSLR